MKKIKFDFYEVVMPEKENEQSISFESIIEQISQLSLDDENRNCEIRGFPIRLQCTSTFNQLWEGELIKIRMNELPIKASLTGVLQPIILKDDEGLGEETAFLYDPKTKTLVIQSNKFGVSASVLSKFFQEKSRLDEEIILLPILQGDVMERLGRMTSFQRLDISVSGINNISAIQSDNYGVSKAIDLANIFSAPVVNLTLSMGHYKGSLNLENVMQSVKKLLNLSQQNEGQIRKLQVSGDSEIDGKDILDLLLYRIQEEIEVEEINRRVPYEVRQAAIRSAWNSRKNEIISRQ